MRPMAIGAVATLTLLSAVMARAEEPQGSSASARYSFYRVRDSFVRLDLLGGKVSECSWEARGWACRVVLDERTALESEIDRMLVTNIAMKQELLDNGLPLPVGMKAQPEPVRPRGQPLHLDEKTSVEEFTEAVSSTWRRLIGMIAQLQRDLFHKS